MYSTIKVSIKWFQNSVQELKRLSIGISSDLNQSNDYMLLYLSLIWIALQLQEITCIYWCPKQYHRCTRLHNIISFIPQRNAQQVLEGVCQMPHNIQS
jgi:hypothetical protein